MIIYKLTNEINGKIYVGQTTRTLEERFNAHKYCNTSYIGKAIHKYGAKNFKKEILAECDTIEELDELEIYFIAKLNSKAPNGYNLTDGGEYHPYLDELNGDGWVIIYREPFMGLTLDAPPAALKVFIALMTKQEFERGVRITKKAIADRLKVSYDNVMRAFKWLKENGYIKEHKVDGQTEFLLNPEVTTCGKNRKKKVELWNSI